MASFQPASVIGLLLKLIALLAVIAIIALAIGVEYYAFKETIDNLSVIATGYSEEDNVVKNVLKSLDLVLLGVIFFAIAAALFELFIQPIDNLPSWLKIENLDDLKAMIVKMVLVVMGVSFTGRIITWAGESEILYIGIALAAVVISFSYFLLIKEQGTGKAD